MDQKGEWGLCPAYGRLTFSYIPGGKKTGTHQMSINGKREGFTYDDFLSVARPIEISKSAETIQETLDAISLWPNLG